MYVIGMNLLKYRCEYKEKDVGICDYVGCLSI